MNGDGDSPFGVVNGALSHVDAVSELACGKCPVRGDPSMPPPIKPAIWLTRCSEVVLNRETGRGVASLSNSTGGGGGAGHVGEGEEGWRECPETETDCESVS